jgi:hypothetical protein
MLAFAFLAVQAAHERSTPPPPGMIPLTCNEIAHLLNLAHIRRRTRDPSHCLRWLTWRPRHQHRARLCHYRARSDHEDRDLRLSY